MTTDIEVQEHVSVICRVQGGTKRFADCRGATQTCNLLALVLSRMEVRKGFVDRAQQRLLSFVDPMKFNYRPEAAIILAPWAHTGRGRTTKSPQSGKASLQNSHALELKRTSLLIRAMPTVRISISNGFGREGEARTNALDS